MRENVKSKSIEFYDLIFSHLHLNEFLLIKLTGKNIIKDLLLVGKIIIFLFIKYKYYHRINIFIFLLFQNKFHN